ncbi:hypothetical protein Pan44_54480 [Caulifigura coniformis]|uniref:Uncharacterized protein n=1 Tax=Caulifigura coniformis TaxID=2527983 RepID=A0A517SMN0_9PLAN|nr:hypothetical protein [Caulifigura coniformis]QDT57379.1 hypothetical protein Pan44_54480 [Caulifigura coniformis]
MTLRLLRNHRIIRRNTRLASEPAGPAPGGIPSPGRPLFGLWKSLQQATAWRGWSTAVLMAACSLAWNTAGYAADEPSDPISKLGQRSALQRWKEARSEWTGMGAARRERRQQQKHGAALDTTFAPDVAAPTQPLPAINVPLDSDPIDPPATIDLSPALTQPEPEAPRFLAPPRHAASSRPTPEAAPPVPAATASVQGEPAPFPVALTPEPLSPPKTASATVEPPIPLPAVQNLPDVPPQVERFAPASIVVEKPAVPETSSQLLPLPDLAPAQPTATALLNQIPRTPVAPSPTPAPPSTRSAPPPAPRLPDDSPRYEIPRSELLVPPAPDAAGRQRFAGPVELPQLKKITEIQPFKSCSTDGSGVKMCPPNTAGEGADRCPEQHPLPVFEGADRNFIDIEYCWDASNLFHTPLYFEDVGLERYGHTYSEPFQSIASATKFGVQLAGLPYQMAMAPVHKREYPLGYYRPGDPAPYKAYQVPLNGEAAFKAAYFYTGMSFIVP